ncbi:MAG: triose-phosphate isomerase [Candidatus Doudnabacteria bacterium]|nr:triose-phosphate isomerase [Candidatus Doudnabacteria bacterium]
MKKLIIANWKMNPKSLEEARSLITRTEHRMNQVADKVQVVVAAPFIYLPPLSHYCHMVKLGAQNMSWLTEGAITGEISAQQLKLFNVSHVILGHSERRLYLGETDSVVNAKIMTALKYKLTPIVCLGGEEDAKQNNMPKIVSRQFGAVTTNLSQKQLEKIIFVYEPVWAISTMEKSVPASSEHAKVMVAYLRKLLAKKIGIARAANMPILYGGTVNRSNVSQFSKHPEISGALVGAASLDSENFWEIIKEFYRESIHRS